MLTIARHPYPSPGRVWLSQGPNRLRLAEVLQHVYLGGKAEEALKRQRGVVAGTEADRRVILAMELAELPLDPLTFASARVVLRYVPCVSEDRRRARETKLSPPTVTSIANEVNEAAELLYGNYLGPGELYRWHHATFVLFARNSDYFVTSIFSKIGMDNVVVEMNKKIAFLTKSLRGEQEALLECRLKASDLQKDLSLTRVRLEDSLAQNAEYGAILKLVRLRKQVERREAGKTEGSRYEIDVEGSLLVARNSRRELEKAKAEAEWWKQVNTCSAIRFRKVYEQSDKHRNAKLAREYKLKLRKSQRRLWRLAASAGWLQQEFAELSTVVERHVRRKLSLFEFDPSDMVAAASAAAAAARNDPPEEAPATPKRQDSGRVATTTQTTPMATPATLKQGRIRADEAIAALRSLETRDERALVEDLGGRIGAMTEQVEHERELSARVVGEKEETMLALRRRIAALEDTIVRESSSSYVDKIGDIRRKPYYSSKRGGSGSLGSGALRASGNIYDRMRAFERRLGASAVKPSRGLARNLALADFSAPEPTTAAHRTPNLAGSDPRPSLAPPARRERSNSAFYRAEIFDLTKALAKANLKVAKTGNVVDRLSSQVDARDQELSKVKDFIAGRHASEASQLELIRELQRENRDARAENDSLRKIAALKIARVDLQRSPL